MFFVYSTMILPEEFYQLTIAIMALCVLWGVVIYVSKGRSLFEAAETNALESNYNRLVQQFQPSRAITMRAT